MAVVTPTPKAQFLKLDGTPMVGGKVYSYAASSNPYALHFGNAYVKDRYSGELATRHPGFARF